ncbi:MAG: NYN domain-containing protein [Nostoc sp. DedVER02]|uniref:LabA-like NYN domain-containing protein n=1 Tax=unclassified Nostoc TaxID=2593658 RepID=UPI002AD33737|nr:MULTISPECIES: NYN domain-containing protein [unclassified Nostoc]MDZ7984800.1 NYN domain-containing protein [Nostoc sp. DedVER02]MDZ8115311.1 NYN domain-containing protein [Nostoc sp. DedVER01b]
MIITNFSKHRNEFKEPKVLKAKPHWQGQNLSDTTVKGKDPKIQDTTSDSSIVNNLNRGRVAIFIDGLNLFHTALQLGIEIDYVKLLCHLTNGSRLLRAFFYTGVDISNEKQQGFLLWMRRNGYRVVAKDITQPTENFKKSNLNVEIAVDMLTLAPYYDTAVLVSGDGDLAYAVNAVSRMGVRVEVVSLQTSTSESLIDVADCFIDLDSIKTHIQKDSNLGYSYRTPSNSNL